MPSGEKITCAEQFIDFYSEVYSYDLATRDLKLEERIEEILKSDTWERKDIIDILRWKVGATSFDYDTENVIYRWGTIEAHDLNDLIFGENISCAQKKISASPKDLLEAYVSTSGIGPVYAIMLLYFQSQGAYPIYDKYAHIAVSNLLNPQDFWSEKSLMKDQELNKQFHSGSTKIDIVWKDYIENFVEPLKNIFDYEAVYKKDRKLDRALWTYGHLFNDTESNRKRMK